VYSETHPPTQEADIEPARDTQSARQPVSEEASADTVGDEITIDLDDHAFYLNRELSLLEFQRRVLEQAQDPTTPLLERVKFLAILSSNLAEFFMVRIAGLKQQVEAGVSEVSTDGRTPAEQLEEARSIALDLIREGRVVFVQLMAELQAEGIYVHRYADLDEGQRRAADEYFDDNVFPVLTPLAFDPGRPFPHISNLSLNLAVLIGDAEGNERFARVKIPPALPRFVPVPTPGGGLLAKHLKKREKHLLLLEDLVAAHLSALFSGMDVKEAHPFKVTRDADLIIQELEADDLLETIEESVRQRRFGSVVRVTISDSTPPFVRSILEENLQVKPEEVLVLAPPLSLSDLFAVYTLDRPDLKYEPFTPAGEHGPELGDGEDVFKAMRERDMLLHRPFDSFDPVVHLIRQAANDPDVLAIKMTLYRVGGDSPIVKSLLAAALNGKEVTVLVELKARFDEESNIEWAKALEAEGVHVVYGLLGLKVHSKVALVVRREGKRIKRYLHVGTGNYNVSTARQYTDLDMLTCNETLCDDATDLFNFLTGYSTAPTFERFLVAPLSLRDDLMSLIRREIEHAHAGRGGRIILKANSLVDRKITRLLYEASQAGVEIDLIMRGICVLRPGIPDVSETIRVRSIVGRFLEHTRIYWFANAGDPEVFIGSADLMGRNLDRRVEVVTPVKAEDLARRLYDILQVYLADNVRARVMLSDGTYEPVRRGADDELIDAQAVFMLEAGHKPSG
jgi:polyphosphate kinase